MTRRRPFGRRVVGGERGAVATLVAVLIAGGVVMGMLALSIDVGGVMYERRQLQNGADAASLALADECAKDLTKCTQTTADSLKAPLLNTNASDDRARYDSRSDALQGVCGRAAGPALPGCDSASSDAPISDLKKCPPLPTWLRNQPSIPYVEAYSRTETRTGSTILPKYFSQLLVGGGPDSSVTACARAAWGPAGGHTGTVPITFSTCEWQRATNGGSTYYDKSPAGPWPGYGASNPWPPTNLEVQIVLHDPQDESTDCVWNNKDTAGGFGYVSGTNCSATITTTATNDSWAKIDPGNNLPSGCDTVIPGLLGKVVFLPVFDCLIAQQGAPTGGIPATANCDPTQRESSGTNSWYHVAGWAKFYLSGYRLSGTGGTVQSSILPGSNYPGPCSASQRCITGWFLKGVLEDASSIEPPGGGTDYGTYAVIPAG